jgi:DNA-binding transcriptional ArsR family regulator
MKDLSPLFNALSNPIRLKIYQRILTEACECELDDKVNISGNCVSELAKDLELNQPTVSNHIKELIAAGLIGVRKVGTRAYLFGTNQSVNDMNAFVKHIRSEVKRTPNSL